MTPFEVADNINLKKERLSDMKHYNAFMINRIFSNTIDTVLFANEMNIAWNLDKQLQYDFYYECLPKKRRFGKWNRKSKDNDIKVIQEYYCYNIDKARSAYPILKDMLKDIKNELYKGGAKKK